MNREGMTVVLALLAVFWLAGTADAAQAGSQPAAGEAKAPVSPRGAPEASDAAGTDDGAGVMSAFALSDRWTGDLDGMVERQRIRVLTTYNLTNYFVDGPRQRGIAYDSFHEFEKGLNKKLRRKKHQVQMLFLPVARDRLIPALLEGRGDIAAANLTITPERQKLVDFTEPFLTGVKEIVVTGPGSPKLESLDDLSGREVWVRASSSYYESLLWLNDRLLGEDKEPVVIKPAKEHQETEDLLEMVNAGLIPITIVDSHMAEFWANIFDDLVLHPELAVRTGGQIGWMVRKQSPQLVEALNEWIGKNRKGTYIGNVLFNRYLRSTKWARSALTEGELAKFKDMLEFFEKYAGKYRFDDLMMVAQGYQESQLDQSARSHVGAVGVMQVLPTTAADMGFKDIEEVEPNIHAGIKYMRWIVDRYFADEDMDDMNKALFAFASYNAGPNRIARLRKKAPELGYDPDVWFNNMELVVSRHVGREPVQYVRNIYKYYIAYSLIVEQWKAKGKPLPVK